MVNQIEVTEFVGLKMFIIMYEEIHNKYTEFQALVIVYYISKTATNSTIHELYTCSNEWKEMSATTRKMNGRTAYHLQNRTKLLRNKNRRGLCGYNK